VIDHDAASMIATIQDRKPEIRTPPGTSWEYNNLAYRLLGVVAERASGQRLRELFHARLIRPAGLPRTAVDDSGEVIRGRASGYELAPAAATGFRNAAPINASWPGGGGAMVSTTDDLCRWHHYLLGGRALKPESLAAMLTPVRLTDGTLPVRPPGADPSGSTAPLTYGFGIRTETQAGRRLVTHTGGIDGFQSELASYPDQQITIAVMTNSGRAEAGPNPNQEALQAALREATRIALT
jgi:CubicO group peptidase (beta-lactamase class C family)